MRRALAVLAAAILAATIGASEAVAQTPECTDPDTQDTCTIQQVRNSYLTAALEKLGIKSAPAKAVVVTQTVAKADEKVTNSNNATTAPDAFAGRLHNNYQDFLNLFAFAINKVDESKDGQALTVRFNPLRTGANLIGLTLTAAKPVIADVVQKHIGDADRTATVAKLNDGLNDLGDITFAGSYSLQSVKCSATDTGRCYGRTADTYRDILAHALEPIFKHVDDESEAQATKQKFAIVKAIPEKVRKEYEDKNLSLFDVPIGMATDPAALRRIVKEFAITEAKGTFNDKEFFSKQHLDGLASLIDNQPQVAITASYRSPGQLSGPKQTAINAELQVGTDNINALRAQCLAGSDDCLSNALVEKLKKVDTTKWVLSATYARNASFKVSDLGLPNPVKSFMSVDEKSSSELKVKGQGGRTFGATVGTQNVRGDFSLEGQRIEKDRVRTKNRWVATATFTMPLGEQMSIPLSLTYANKAEFLGDQGRKLGAHLGISYRLPMRPKVPQP
jgi:hypothetical protein